MRQFLAILFIVLSWIIASSIDAPACPASDQDLVQVLGEDKYFAQCPYGDAIILTKEEREFLGKPVGTPVDCVNWDNNLQKWVTKDYDFAKRAWKNKQTFDGEVYEVWSMDGKLSHNLRGDVMVEKVYLSATDLDKLGM